MNNTKWNELRLAMYNLGEQRPRWRAKELSGFLTNWDGEWYYHFNAVGYDTIEWVEIQISSNQQDAAVLAQLRGIHLPGQRIENGFRIYGYINNDTTMDYI